jgi:hypothetical protein
MLAISFGNDLKLDSKIIFRENLSAQFEERLGKLTPAIRMSFLTPR